MHFAIWTAEAGCALGYPPPTQKTLPEVRGPSERVSECAHVCVLSLCKGRDINMLQNTVCHKLGQLNRYLTPIGQYSYSAGR